MNCAFCDKEFEPVNSWQRYCSLSCRVKGFYKQHPKYGRKYRDLRKIEVLTHYGNGKCACVICGESRLACLSIDHIIGNGMAEKRKYGYKSGQGIYRWLKRNGYPVGYQTLCMNCQWVSVLLTVKRVGVGTEQLTDLSCRLT